MVWKQERERNAEVKEVVTAVGTCQVSMSYRGARGGNRYEWFLVLVCLILGFP